MSTVTWYEGYNAGVEIIDTQHRDLFKQIEGFKSNPQDYAEVVSLRDFLSGFITSLMTHFITEESFLRSKQFPLIDHHISMHTKVKRDLTDILLWLSRGELKHPTDAIGLVLTDYEHHMFEEDVSAFEFCKDEIRNVTKAIEGNACEVFTPDNKLIAKAVINRARIEGVEITHDRSALPVKIGDRLKIVSSDKDNSITCFTALVTAIEKHSIVMTAGVVIRKLNSRQSYRVATNIEATMWMPSMQTKFNVKILDISTGGMLVESDTPLHGLDYVLMEYIFNNKKYKHAVNVVRNRGTSIGCSFVSLNRKQKEDLTDSINVQQNRNYDALMKKGKGED